MAFTLPFIFALFTVDMVVSHAALTPEFYWNKVLPGTSMPKAIRESLNSELMEEESTSVTVGKVHNINGIIGKVRMDGNINSIAVAGREKYGKHYGTPATATQLKYDPNITLYFYEEDLVPGKTFNLQFTKAFGPVSFLPRKMADSIPFSSHNLTNILNQFSINPKSKEANIMRETITECEDPGIPGEQRYCATSLESMIDFSTKIIGKKNVKAVSTESNEDMQIKKYKIEDSVNNLTGDDEVNAPSVVCHKQKYVYAVFYCHSIKSTKIYMVPLKSEDGRKVNAVAACHEDTSKWNPKHLAFQVLKVKPGTVPICHFLAVDTVVWCRNYK